MCLAAEENASSEPSISVPRLTLAKARSHFVLYRAILSKIREKPLYHSGPKYLCNSGGSKLSTCRHITCERYAQMIGVELVFETSHLA